MLFSKVILSTSSLKYSCGEYYFILRQYFYFNVFEWKLARPNGALTSTYTYLEYQLNFGKSWQREHGHGQAIKHELKPIQIRNSKRMEIYFIFISFNLKRQCTHNECRQMELLMRWYSYRWIVLIGKVKRKISKSATKRNDAIKIYI